MSSVRDAVRRAVCQGAPVLLALGLALAACGDGGEPSAAADAVDCAVSATETPSEVALDTSGAPPEELQVERLADPPSPDCPEAIEGDLVTVHYTGRSWSTGEVFDSSLGGAPFSFELGAGDVIAGWDQGIAGLQVGERARLTIPPELAYGESGAGGVIGPDETLVFDVQLVDVTDAPDAATSSPTTG